MTTLLSQLRSAADRHFRYRRTVSELRAMPLDVALDLDIFPGDARAIAHRAVYGH